MPKPDVWILRGDNKAKWVLPKLWQFTRGGNIHQAWAISLVLSPKDSDTGRHTHEAVSPERNRQLQLPQATFCGWNRQTNSLNGRKITLKVNPGVSFWLWFILNSSLTLESIFMLWLPSVSLVRQNSTVGLCCCKTPAMFTSLFVGS